MVDSKEFFGHSLHGGRNQMDGSKKLPALLGFIVLATAAFVVLYPKLIDELLEKHQ